MTVYCLIPVHNRLEATKSVLRALAVQDFTDLRVVVIDDGSTDGTGEYLRSSHPKIDVLRGGGDLWWAGAVALGISAVLPRATNDDYILFQNNDASFRPDYVRTLVDVSRRYGDAVVGSPLRDAQRPDVVFSIGPAIDYFAAHVGDLISVEPDRAVPDAGNMSKRVIAAEGLSGRGTLYPVRVLRKIGSVRHRLLPHYWADYEISARAHRAGSKTLVALDAPVWTGTEVSGVQREEAGVLQTLFSRRSRHNLIDAMIFFTLVGPWYLRLTAVPRVIWMKTWRGLRSGATGSQ